MSDLVKAVNDYYGEVWHGRIRNWHHSDALAIHFGIDQVGENDHQEARLRLNTELLEHLLDRGVRIEWAHLADLGCGICGTAIEFVETNPTWTITAVGCDGEMMAMAKRFIEQRGGLEGGAVVDRINLVCADFHNVVLSDETHDAIYAIDSVCHSWDRDKLLANVVPSLKPGGILAVVDVFPRMMTDESVQEWETFCRGMQLNPDRYDHIEGDMSEAGLVDVEWIDLSDRVSAAVRDLSDKASESLDGATGAWRDHLEACRAGWWLLQHGAVHYGIVSGAKRQLG